MTDRDAIDWLLDRGGPSIRYLTATELVDGSVGVDVERLESELLASEASQVWLERLERVRDIHGSSDLHLENVLGKLTQLGVRCGMQPFDRRVAIFRGMLGKGSDVLALLNSSIIAAGLARAGCDDLDLCDFLHRRIEHLYATASRSIFAIYLKRQSVEDYPSTRKEIPLIDPQFYPAGRFDLPWIHDLHAFARLPAATTGAATTRKVNSIVNYVLHPDYQRLREGYGVFHTEDGRYLVMGWSAHLPGYPSFPPEGFDAMRLVHRVELMSHFVAAQKHPWFKRAIEHLESHRTSSGTYRFPRHYLEELRAGYWVNGARMGLEGGRRSLPSIELESTFRMLRIQRRMGRARREKAGASA